MNHAGQEALPAASSLQDRAAGTHSAHGGPNPARVHVYQSVRRWGPWFKVSDIF